MGFMFFKLTAEEAERVLDWYGAQSVHRHTSEEDETLANQIQTFLGKDPKKLAKKIAAQKEANFKETN